MTTKAVEKAKGFLRAYPEDIPMFSPITDTEHAKQGDLISRVSAAMGRHCGKTFVTPLLKYISQIEKLDGDYFEELQIQEKELHRLGTIIEELRGHPELTKTARHELLVENDNLRDEIKRLKAR